MLRKTVSLFIPLMLNMLPYVQVQFWPNRHSLYMLLEVDSSYQIPKLYANKFESKRANRFRKERFFFKSILSYANQCPMATRVLHRTKSVSQLKKRFFELHFLKDLLNLAEWLMSTYPFFIYSYGKYCTQIAGPVLIEGGLFKFVRIHYTRFFAKKSRIWCLWIKNFLYNLLNTLRAGPVLTLKQ